MALFGMLKTGEGSLTITLPEWMSKEMVEMFVGGFVTGLGAGAIAGTIKALGKLEGFTAALVDTFVNGLVSYGTYRLAAEGKFKNFAFGGMIVTGFMAFTGLINLILQAFKINASMVAPWEGFSIGNYAVVKAFSGVSPARSAAPSTVVVSAAPTPVRTAGGGARLF